MLTIPTPQAPRYKKTAAHTGAFEVTGCYPGYGTTLGNALRRVLLSSLEGAAITSVKIKGVSHEFSTIDGVMEDSVQIILNLKKVRFIMHGDDPVTVTLKAKKEGPVTAEEISTSSQIEVVNGDHIIAHITDKKAELDIEMQVGRGLGYVPVEQQEREEKEIGRIAIDAVYTPIRRVNYRVENMRVGKRTDYEKIVLDIETDGSIAPEDAFAKAVAILGEQYAALQDIGEAKEKVVIAPDTRKEDNSRRRAVAKEKEKDGKAQDALEQTIEQLPGLSTRTLNVLETQKLETVSQIIALSEKDLAALDGMGNKGIKEIRKAIGEFGLTLKQS